jgi:hypothetical protein
VGLRRRRRCQSLQPHRAVQDIRRCYFQTTVSGEINCLDSGGFGVVTITKAITISCEGVIAGIVASGTNGIVVNAAGAVVVLHGLDINGVGTGLAGINIIAASAVQVHKSSIRNFNAGNNNGWGITAAPTAATRIDVTDSIISNNGSASTGGGIRIRPIEAGTVTGAISQGQSLEQRRHRSSCGRFGRHGAANDIGSA